MRFIYDFIFFILAIFYFPILLLKGKWHKGFLMRFGKWPEDVLKAIQGKKNIWFHAVSVGEVLAIQGLIAKIRQDFPGHQIVLSTVTKTGYQLACSKMNEDVVVYAPLDFSFVVNKYIRTIRPEIYITAETEIWPNLFLSLQKNNIKVVLVNGRISDKSFDRYKIIQKILRKILNAVNIFCMQSSMDASRIRQLGAEENRVKVVGNMKFDDLPEDAGETLQDFGYQEHDSLWIAGSTHAGEERIALDVFDSLSQEFPNLRLVIVPRHIERAEEIVQLVREKGYVPVKFTQKNSSMNEKTILIIDTIGHLKSLYRLATVVFVGKSLTAKGGQNIIEPAFFAKPIIVGPNTQNFRDVNDFFLQAKAIVQVRNEEELLAEIKKLLMDASVRQRLGEAAKSVVHKCQGATSKTLEIIEKVLVP